MPRSDVAVLDVAPDAARVRPRRLPSLDGLRAVAIAVVIGGHLCSGYVSGSGVWAREVYSVAGHGVTLFLVISGFLITRLLLVEQRRTGRISLSRFYLRRTVRIWPALWLMLAVTVLLAALGQVVSPRGVDLIAAATFVMNYLPGNQDGILHHTWSLSLEEQFYLLWPVLFLLLRRRRAATWLAGAVLVAPVVRVAVLVGVPALRETAQYQFTSRYDSLAIGCLVAVLWDDARFGRWVDGVARRGGGPIAVAVLVVTVATSSWLGRGFQFTVGYSLENVCVAYLLARAVRAPRARGVRWLNAPPMVWIGRISYSLYLWQQLFVVHPPAWMRPVWVAVPALMAVAAASYYLVERPTERLRRRLHPDAVAAQAGARDRRPELTFR
jgi:peptidoglycan/LPS O-acetylase OafA/YrhL